jgi:hypothetical protein
LTGFTGFLQNHSPRETSHGNVLTNAKVTTTLTSYFLLFYTTEIAIEGTAAKFTILAAPPSADELPPEAKP